MKKKVVGPTKPTQEECTAHERQARERQEKHQSVAAINRAIKHLRDWQHRLTEDGYSALAAEVETVANDLSTPACLLGAKAAFTMSLGDVLGGRETKMTLQGVGN